ncbi:NPCBM/NEW2 domain-containing protein, partial [Streptomyces clavuligerus]
PPAAAGVTALAPTPPMGFNNWNSTHCRPEFNETMIKGVADTLVAKGLRDAGYRYVNLDDCWALPQRNAAGDLVPDPVRFPSGIKALADYVHAKGLKFGIYSSAGTRTCDVQGFPGGLGNERRDAALWASWGVDYLKYDNCHNNGVDARQRYRAMAEALRATGREILLSVCEWGENAPWEWAGEYGSAWRTTGDIADTWDSMLGIARRNQELAPYARPGAWNDPDMLEVGNGGMTDTEYRTHFSLWSQMAAPLLIGSDLRTATPATLEILTNREVIAVNQDPLGRQGTVVSRSGGLVVMTKPLADGGRSVTLTNETAAARTVTTTAEAIGLGGSASYTLRDLWTRQNRTTADTIAATVPAHGTVMYRVTPGEPVPPPHGLSRVGDLRRLSADSNWGPVERDRSNGEQAPGDGRPLTVGGTAYARGLGVHAPSTIGYHLGGACRSLTVDVGVDDEMTAGGSVVFRVLRDGAVAADSGLRTASDPPLRLTADLTGARELRLVVTDGGDGFRWDHADWAEPTLACGRGPAAGTQVLSTLPWSSAAGGWGPVERDRSNGEQAAGDGRLLTVGGTVTADGLGTHAPSAITYYLGGDCTRLTTGVGVDDETGPGGSVVFQVLRDGAVAADSGRLTGADPARTLTADLSGALELRLVVTDAGDGTTYDHADWLAPRLDCR